MKPTRQGARHVQDLAVLLALAWTCLITNLTGHDVGPLRALTGITLILFTTGYCTTVITHPSRIPLEHRIALAVGVSVSLTAMTGVALNMTSSGLTESSWTATLVGLATVLIIVAGIRRIRVRGARSASTWEIHGLSGWRPRPLVAGLLSLALALTIAAVVFARQDAASVQTSAGVTSLWMLPEGHTSEVELGIEHDGQDFGEYDLVLKRGDTVLQRWPHVDIKPGHTWTATIAIPNAGLDKRLRAVLYSGGKPFRTVQFNPPSKASS